LRQRKERVPFPIARKNKTTLCSNWKKRKRDESRKRKKIGSTFEKTARFEE
jgi:hypothetical protein